MNHAFAEAEKSTKSAVLKLFIITLKNRLLTVFYNQVPNIALVRGSARKLNL